MQERHAASVRARNGRLVDQAEARFFEARQVRFDVVDAQADVVNPFAAPLDEPGDGRLRGGRLEQLETRIADGEERGANSLRLDGLDVIDGQAEGLVDLRRVDGSNGDRPNLLDPRVLGQTFGDPNTSSALLPRSALWPRTRD